MFKAQFPTVLSFEKCALSKDQLLKYAEPLLIEIEEEGTFHVFMLETEYGEAITLQIEQGEQQQEKEPASVHVLYKAGNHVYIARLCKKKNLQKGEQQRIVFIHEVQSRDTIIKGEHFLGFTGGGTILVLTDGKAQ